MQQAVMTKPGVIIFNEVSDPIPGKSEVLIETKRIGVCGSDIHVYHGKHPYTSYPVVQGHEVSGQVIELGEDVRGFEIGDRVTIQPQEVCGKCLQCRSGKYHICDELKVMGFQTTGTASGYFCMDAQKVLKLPPTLSWEYGAMIEPLAVAVHALDRGGEITGKNILVLGAGPIGNLTAQAAKGMGAEKVMITDISAYRLEAALRCNIDYAVNPGTQDLGLELVEAFGADKADLILECAGVNQTIDQAIDYARKGSDIIIVGVFGDKPRVDLGLLQDRELRLIGTLMYQKADYEKAIELVAEEKILFDPLISKTFAFTDYLKAYEFIEENPEKALKVFVKGPRMG